MVEPRIIVALDFNDRNEAISFCKKLSPEMCRLKVGLELYLAAGEAVINELHDMGFSVFLDLKFHDIPVTVQQAIRSGSCLRQASFVTVHCDPSLLEVVVDAVPDSTKVLAVTVLTSLGTDALLSLGIREELAREPVQLVLHRAAIARKAGCDGVVCSGHEAEAVKNRFGDDLIVVAPGIRPDWGEVKKDDQRRIVTPYQAIKSGADYIVVGRPIRTSADPVQAAARVVEEIKRGLQDQSVRG